MMKYILRNGQNLAKSEMTFSPGKFISDQVYTKKWAKSGKRQNAATFLPDKFNSI